MLDATESVHHLREYRPEFSTCRDGSRRNQTKYTKSTQKENYHPTNAKNSFFSLQRLKIENEQNHFQSGSLQQLFP